MGMDNGWDPYVDARAFLPVPLREAMLSQVVKGRRPLVEVVTSDTAEFNSAFEALSREVPKGRTLRVAELERSGESNIRYAIYDPDLVKARATTFSTSLSRLGVEPGGSPEQLVRNLDRLPAGLHIMQGDDPESGIMYTWYRQHSMKGNWQEGTEVTDISGPHREFTPEQKKAFFFRDC
jgi:hypothetical protein